MPPPRNPGQIRISAKNAFTLAEVLITLGIIGVVAALTMPSLIQHHQKQVTLNKLKKTYSTISQIVISANNNTVPANEFLTAGTDVNADTTKEFFNTYWLPYFKGANVLTTSPYKEEMPYFRNDGNRFANQIMTAYSYGRILFTAADGVIYYINIMYWNDSNEETGEVLDPKYGTTQAVIFDINGTQGPNKLGRDIFRVEINYTKNSVVPYGISDIGRINSNCKAEGNYCFAKIVRDGWKIADDYPW